MSEAATGTVFVVDDEPDVREAIRLLLRSVERQVEVFDSAAALFAAVGPERPGCLILDVRLPGMNGMRAQQELQNRGYRLPVVFISGHGDIPMAVRAVQAGALDFLEKPFSDDALLDCVDRALAADQANRARSETRDAVERDLAELTPREREVLVKLIEGKVNKIIARELDVSTRTVEIHRARVLQKMNVRNAQQLVRRVMESGAEAGEYRQDEATSAPFT